MELLGALQPQAKLLEGRDSEQDERDHCDVQHDRQNHGDGLKGLEVHRYTLGPRVWQTAAASRGAPAGSPKVATAVACRSFESRPDRRLSQPTARALPPRSLVL